MIIFLAILSLKSASAMPIPPKEALNALDSSWPSMELRVDVRNLVGEGDAGKIDDEEMKSCIDAANVYWTQCGIHFVVRNAENVEAAKLKVPYEPKSQGDLSLIAGALNPNGFDGAIPFTIAGPWTFRDESAKMYLHGLGWVFLNGANKIDRIGAMVGAQRIRGAGAGPLIGHELGHTLLLGHSSEADNLMAGGTRLKMDQCSHARRFAETALSEFLVSTKPQVRVAKVCRSGENCG